MNFILFRLKYDPLFNWTLKGIPRGTYPLYKMWENNNPDKTEKELSVALFNRRFSITIFESKYQEKTRIKSYFEKNPNLRSLEDMCIASAMIEFKISPDNNKAYKFIKKTISVELFKLGHRTKNKTEG